MYEHWPPPYILKPFAALTHSPSNTLLTLFRIRLPPIRAWKNLTLFSSLISKNADKPDTETTCEADVFGLVGQCTSKGFLSDATIT
jgi:hypothetical protein